MKADCQEQAEEEAAQEDAPQRQRRARGVGGDCHETIGLPVRPGSVPGEGRHHAKCGAGRLDRNIAPGLPGVLNLPRQAGGYVGLRGEQFAVDEDGIPRPQHVPKENPVVMKRIALQDLLGLLG